MQNRTDFGTPHFCTPQLNMDVSSYNIAIKVLTCAKYGLKVCNFFKFVVCFQYFKFSFHYMCRQVRIRLQSVVIKTWHFCSTYSLQ